MDIDARHTLLREKLNSLGFTQPLPFGSLAVVSALLDDLILTNKNLKDAKKTISELEKVTLIALCDNRTPANKMLILCFVFIHSKGENRMEFGRRAIQVR